MEKAERKDREDILQVKSTDLIVCQAQPLALGHTRLDPSFPNAEKDNGIAILKF